MNCDICGNKMHEYSDGMYEGHKLIFRWMGISDCNEEEPMRVCDNCIAAVKGMLRNIKKNGRLGACLSGQTPQQVSLILLELWRLQLRLVFPL